MDRRTPIHQQDEKKLIAELRQNSKKAFSILFNAYYKDLVLFGGNFLPEKTYCEDIVQTVFMKLWNDRSDLFIETSLKSYLLKSVQNKCLDELRHREIIRTHEEYIDKSSLSIDCDTEDYILFSNLQEQLEDALLHLPEKLREAFEMNRMEGLKYKEIAEKLNVSERTIEVRIGKALQLLRIKLKDFIGVLFGFIIMLIFVIKM